MAEEERAFSILVVDDEDAIRAVLRLILVHAGYEVAEAENGEDALKKVQEEKPDLMILDVMMPGMDGFSVCEQIREDSETADMPVFMLSARTDSRSRNRGKQVGATKYLTKPLAPDQLLFHINETLAGLKK